MSAVGLSFGSPTSGDGFNVTNTVNEIISNMQSVETPWKNQLKSLESQDTALTSIGTDLSSLSTALQSLTDFEGVLSEKQGSSSDTSVLELTAASTSAVAGSHTIVVNSLAQTSSYYTDSVSSSDTLSGSFTIQVGSGKAQTIQINSTNNTLSSLASAINSGSYGVTANVITDSSGSRLELVSNTSGSGGDITLGGAISDSTSGKTISFTEAQAGKDASLTVDGIAVTSSSNTVTNALPGVTFQLLSASPNTSVQVQITNDNSAVESAMSSLVTAYNKVMSDLNTQEGDDSSGSPEPLYGNSTVSNLQQSLESALNFAQASNATSTSAAIASSDQLSGSVSITVGGKTQTVSVDKNNDTLQGLADAINAAGIGVTANIITSGNDSTLSLVNGSSGSSGVISVDSNLNDATTGQAITFGSSVSNAITSASQLGITVNNDGTLTLNTDTLDAALNSNYQSVVNFLQPSGSFTSFGGNLTNVLNSLSSSNPTGALSLALKQNSTVESQLNQNVTNEENLIASKKQTLTTELNEANETLEEIPSQLNQINEMYSAITGYNSGSNG